MAKQNKQFLKGLLLGCLLGGIVLGTVSIIIGLGLEEMARAQEMETVREVAGYREVDLIVLVGRIIKVFLGLLGVVALCLIIYGGFVWMTAGGSDDKIFKAKKILRNALIGLVIILAAYGIVAFIFRKAGRELIEGEIICTPGTCTGCHRVCNSQGTGSDYTEGCIEACGSFPGSSFVIRWHDPKDGEENVSLCRAIQAGFNDELDPDTVNADNILIKIKDGADQNQICLENKDCASGKCEANRCIGKTVAGNFTVKEKVFKFRAEKDFEKNTIYQVEITTRVRSRKNLAVKATDPKRKWVFSTGSTTDTIPPRVIKVYPEDGDKDVCLTAPIEALFNEPMDVISLMDKDALSIDPELARGFSRNVNNADTLIANPRGNYQENTKYTPLLNSNIIADSCGNLLDGDADGVAEGSPDDDYAPPPIGVDPDWSFTTGTTEYCTPEITEVSPSSEYYDGGLVTVKGNYFTLGGEVIFSDNVYADWNCFDSNFYPGDVCVSSWDNHEIKLKVPAGGGVSNGAINGGIWVEIGELLSNGLGFDVLSPHINWISPEKGGPGQSVTISGANFGDSQGKVYFVDQDNHTLKREAEFPCENSWKNNRIIIKVPENPPLAQGDYYLQVVTFDGHYSNIKDFLVNDQLPGPLICELEPDCGLVNEPVIIKGEKFGTTQGKVYFGDIEASIDSWLPTEIKTKVPEGIKEGYSIVKVKIGETESNGLFFASPCGLGDPCDSDPTTPACDLGACSGNKICSAEEACTCVSILDHCVNGIQDADEEGIDCGGADCPSCGGGQGDPCDGDKSTLSCDPDDSICQIDLICRTTDCTCQPKGQEGDPCSSNPDSCEPDDNKCDDTLGFTCNPNNCKCTKKPFITEISPFNGMVEDPVTTYVTIRGGNFGQKQGSSKIYFGDKEAGVACQTWSDNEIIVAAPFGIKGTVPIKVVTSQGESNTKDFTVNDIIRPSICSLIPNHGKAGDKITISGTNFGDQQINDEVYKSLVLFEDIEAEVNSWKNDRINVTVPNGITIRDPKVKVVLKWEKAPEGTSSNEVTFYMDPFITSLNPNKGPIDTYVTIRGGNFGTKIGRVVFNDVQAELAPCRGAWSDTEIIVLAPDSSTGPVVVKVTLPNGDVIESNKDKIFTYNNDPLAPGICLDKTEGKVNDPVIIKGNKFGSSQGLGEGVTFNKVKAAPTFWSNYRIDTNVPQTTSGDVVVTKIGQRQIGMKCQGGVYVLGVCVGGTEVPVYEEVTLNSNPVWFRIIGEGLVCGNNVREGTEICDGTDLDNKTCQDFELSGDGLKCKPDCSGFDTSECSGPSGVCGDGEINPGETCDKDNLAGKKCSDFDDYVEGDLTCDENCEFDYSDCRILPPKLPSVISYSPKGDNVCRNVMVTATFDQLMDKASLNKNTIIVEGLEGKVSSYDENDKTVVVFTPKEDLDPQTTYQVTIKKEVRSKTGENMVDDYQWTFKTGDYYCQINKVDIKPSARVFFAQGEEEIFTSQAYDKSGLAIQATYFWKTDSIDNFVESEVVADNQIKLTAKPKNGEGFLYVQADAYGGTKEASAQIQVFLCENPWLYEDPLTHFRTFYCRD